ncbi:WYL domain-containing protein [Phascolarctobacterium succinatutens]|uniref:WYL domain-containing protein n=1 Tax=Phascolarctobacterium succinatutens TaxID=626940 RepID=UPI0026F19F8C|nr:WYL domain-containing protein [Phascolarctobacterium succinatutens]
MKREMSTVFSEVYGTYYNVVAKVLAQAIEGRLSAEGLQELVRAGGYGDSALQLLPALGEGTWRLLTPELTTPLQNKPTMPLTLLQKRWLKTLLLDEKIGLFFTDEQIAQQQAALQEVEPLYKPEQFVFFDRFVDGDAYSNPRYRANFREILQAVREKRLLNASYRSNRGTIIVWTDLLPVSLEYSAKDDKFRLQAIAERKQVTLNLGRLVSVEAGEAAAQVKTLKKSELMRQRLVLEIEDERSTMVRALMHFSDLEKETEKLDETHYLLTVQYDKGDETEMLFRVLSFGPTLRVREPESFKELIREKLREQLQ